MINSNTYNSYKYINNNNNNNTNYNKKNKNSNNIIINNLIKLITNI